MTPRYRGARAIALLAASSLVAAACSGDKDDKAVEQGDGTVVPDGQGNPDCQLDEPLRIGYAADFNVGGIGDIPATKAAEYIVERQNAEGGVGGQDVEIDIKQISQDPQDFAEAQRIVQKMIDDGADIILGPPFVDYGFPILETTAGEIPVLFVTSTETALPDPAQGSFLVSFSDAVQGAAAGEFATRQGFTTAVTITSTDFPYLTDNPVAFTAAFEATGGTVVDDLSFSFGATDFSEQVNAIASMESPPDVIYSAFFLPDAGVFLQQLRAAGIQSAVISADGFDASQIWTLGDDAEGVFFTSHTFPAASNGVQAFIDEYTNAGNDPLETVSFGALGADAALIAIAAAQTACSTDGAALISAISGITVDVVTGTTSYAGTAGTPKRDVTILTVTNGEPAFVEAFYPETVGG